MEIFNEKKSVVCASVEWLFADIINYFKFLDFKKNLRAGLSMSACCICICCSLKTSIFSLSCVWCSLLIFMSSAFSRSLTLALSAKYLIASPPLLRWRVGLSSLSSADESRPGRIELLHYLFPVFPVIPLCLFSLTRWSHPFSNSVGSLGVIPVAFWSFFLCL